MDIPFGHIEDGKLFRDAAGDFSTIELKLVEGNEMEESVVHYQERFDKLQTKFLQVESKINNSGNKGSFLSSLLNIQEQLATHEGLGDYQQLNERIQQYVNLLEDYVAKNRQKNTDIKTALLMELEAVLANNDIEEAFEQIKDLKARWIKTGSPNEELKEELESKFKEGVDGFFAKRNAFDDDKKELIEARISEYQSIIDQIKAINKAKNWGQTFDEVKALQADWKEMGRIPEDAFKQLNDAYWEQCKTYFDQRKKGQKEASKKRDKSKKESLAQRREVIAKLESLKEESLVSEKALKVKSIQAEWKKCGPLSRRDNPEIHDQFLTLSREVQERQFVVELAKKKIKGFSSKEGKERFHGLMKVTKDLLKRDESELASFKENMDKMHINKGSFVDMLESKLKNQQEKVAIKRSILKDIQAKIK